MNMDFLNKLIKNQNTPKLRCVCDLQVIDCCFAASSHGVYQSLYSDLLNNYPFPLSMHRKSHLKFGIGSVAALF